METKVQQCDLRRRIHCQPSFSSTTSPFCSQNAVHSIVLGKFYLAEIEGVTVSARLGNVFAMSSEVLWMVLPGIVREAQSAGVLSPQESHSLHRELQPLLREFVILQESANPAGVSTPAGLVESLYCQSPPIYKTAIRAISWSQRPRARGGSSGRNSLNIWK